MSTASARRAVITLVAAVALTALAASPLGAGLVRAQQPSALGIELVMDGLEEPLYLTSAGDARLFVVERGGRIRILTEEAGEWRIAGTFLDLRGHVTTAGSEQGLLGLAFHPGYAENGRFYVHFTDRVGDVVVAEYRRASASRADPDSGRRLLKIRKPLKPGGERHQWHNGGWLGFRGESLFIAIGDGGVFGDPQGNAQDKGSLLGKILRIHPLDPDGTAPARYSIPVGNPFVGKPGRDEIWALGLRNPWRASIDPATGDLWIADVGAGSFEEVNHAGDAKGRNFGWNLLEGAHLYPSGDLCTSGCLTLPVAEYAHGDGRGCAVTGGYVSRRPGAALEGDYVFGDFCSGSIWHIPATFSGGVLPVPLETPLLISSFGQGLDRELYVLDLRGGVYRITGS